MGKHYFTFLDHRNLEYSVSEITKEMNMETAIYSKTFFLTWFSPFHLCFSFLVLSFSLLYHSYFFLSLLSFLLLLLFPFFPIFFLKIKKDSWDHWCVGQLYFPPLPKFNKYLGLKMNLDQAFVSIQSCLLFWMDF